MNNFTHLNLHTEYSFIDSIIKIGQIICLYKDLKIKTICVTDLLTVCSFYEYYFYCYENNIKPMIGSQCFVLVNGNVIGIILLAKTFIGYKNIMNILSNSWIHGNINNGVFVKLQWINKNFEDLIVIVNLRFLLLNEFGYNESDIKNLINSIYLFFEDNFYLEINKINLPFENYINEKIFNISKKLKIKLVGTNSVKFLFKEDFISSLGKVLISQEDFDDSELFFEYTDQQYIKNYNEFNYCFRNLKKCVKNVSNIVNDCNLLFKSYGFNLPRIKVDKFKVRKKIFNNLLKKGLKNRVLKKNKNILVYLNRINKEIIIIKKMCLIDYFLIIFEFIFWSRKRNIPSGPGRGSGASSLVSYALYITDIDPVNENLLFERFLTSERQSMPDLDLDFCVLERNSLIDHMFDYYEYNNTSQIITFHNLSIKSLIRDLSRAVGLDYLSGDRFSKSIPFSLELCMEDIFRKYLSIRSFISSNQKCLDIWRTAIKIEGIYATISKHAGGVIISKNNMFNLTAILFDDDDCLSQYEKSYTQEIGLLKFDFLGLKTISVIHVSLSIIPENSTGEFNIDDYQTYQMINSLETDLVFQLESNGMKKMIQRSSINNIYDIISYLSLFRPGPIQTGCLNIFLNRKNNLEETYYPYKEDNFLFLKIFLSYTHGIMVFQEQVIQIILVFFECTIYDSEKIFNFMINNSFDKLNFLFYIFEKKCKKLNLLEVKVQKLFFLIVNFACYSFNRTHAHSYAKIVYQTAFIKANYLLEYCISNIYVDQLLNIDLDRIIFNLKTIGIIFYKPDINISDENFKIYKKGILYGFSIVKFIDEEFIDKILYYRNKIFFYNNFEIFCKIFSIFKINNKNIIENLIFCGFFDCFRMNRVNLYINFQFIFEKIYVLKQEYNRSIIYKYLNFMDYSKLPYINEKTLYVFYMDMINIEKKLLKFAISNIPSDFYYYNFLGHKYYNTLYRMEKLYINIVIATVKKKFFYEKKINIFRIFNNEKIFVIDLFSRFVAVPNEEFAFVFLLRYNEKKFKFQLIRCLIMEYFMSSIGSVIILIINNIFKIFNIISYLFNFFSINGSIIFIKSKKFFLNTKLCIKINEEIILNLKFLGLNNFFNYYSCK